MSYGLTERLQKKAIPVQQSCRVHGVLRRLLQRTVPSCQTALMQGRRLFEGRVHHQWAELWQSPVGECLGWARHDDWPLQGT